MNTRTSAIALILVGLACGCASLGGGMSDEDLILKTLGEWKAAAETEDVDAMMTAYSEDYSGRDGASKDGVRDFLSNAQADGYMDGIEAILEDLEIAIDGETATAGPVELSGNFGTYILQFELRKEEGKVWRIMGQSEG